jgi:hypothetical protein
MFRVEGQDLLVCSHCFLLGFAAISFVLCGSSLFETNPPQKLPKAVILPEVEPAPSRFPLRGGKQPLEASLGSLKVPEAEAHLRLEPIHHPNRTFPRRAQSLELGHMLRAYPPFG